jgi:hypothetical protein
LVLVMCDKHILNHKRKLKIMGEGGGQAEGVPAGGTCRHVLSRADGITPSCGFACDATELGRTRQKETS